jgi:hypothetical protein
MDDRRRVIDPAAQGEAKSAPQMIRACNRPVSNLDREFAVAPV